ncbi:hypothetical protein EAF00_004970 [Botryotinia globosa]|nr:hypothetical protein EAF00_004970 [Botryotinia globosa]
MSSILSKIAQGLEGEIFELDSDGYEASLKSYFTLHEAQLKPSFIITPKHAQDVAHVLKSLRTVNSATDVATKLGQVYDKLDPLGLSVVGGHVYDVGVGGFTLGGCFSSSLPRYGMCCDMVENFEVVLADGQIINANANANPDLWIALKGGSNNFGIVTRFDMKKFPQGKQWAGLVAYPIPTLDENFRALNSMQNDWDPYASMKLAKLPETSRKLQAKGTRQIFATTSFRFSVAHLQEVYALLKSAATSVEDIKGMRWTLKYWRLHDSITAKSRASGGNSTGLDTSQGSIVLCILNYSWEDKSDDERMDGTARRFIEEVDESSKSTGLFNRYKYINYSAGHQDPISGYGDEMKSNLQAVSKKYDPEGFFQTGVPGGFKILR